MRVRSSGWNRVTVNHILVVDDDPAIRDVVADILEMSDYRVKTATNGAEALDFIRDEPPSAVLLDLMMPVMDGWEFLRRCRDQERCAQVPVVVMSAARDIARAASELGAQAYLSKPFDMDAVLAIVERVAEQFPFDGCTRVPPGRPGQDEPSSSSGPPATP